MQRNIHPNYFNEVEIVCACGSTLVTGSIIPGPIRVEICSQCHPFFTGEKRLVDTEGRADRFVRQREEAQKQQEELEVQTKKKEKPTREKKQQDKPLTLRELLQQSR